MNRSTGVVRPDGWLHDPGPPIVGRTDAAVRHRVGSVSFRSEATGIRSLVVSGTEVVRRIFITVRDTSWREVPPTAWSSEVDEGEGSWRLRLAASYANARGETQFAWRGLFTVDRDRAAASFQVVGTAIQPMHVNRVGLVVLHPTTVVGGRISTGGRGRRASFVPTERLMPQHVVDGLPTGITDPFDRLIVQLQDRTVTDFRFEGSLFEIEDQRNFGDDSFKSYCPPLASGFPHAIAAGTRLAQSVSIEAAGATATAPSTPARTTRGRLPRLARHGHSPAHPLFEPAPPVGTTLPGYLVEINRGEPVALTGGLSFTACPAVHSGDALTIAENVPAIPAMVRTAIELSGGPVSTTLSLQQGPEVPAEICELLALPWTLAVLGALVGTGVQSVSLADDLFPAAARDAWRSALDILSAARAASEVSYRAGTGPKQHFLSWGDELLVINLDDESSPLPGQHLGVRTIWPRPAIEVSEVPAYGVVHVRKGS